MRGETLLLWYFAAVSVLSFGITVYDKLAAKYNPRHRIRERTLFLVAFLGGSPVMYLTMHLIRHKTKHRSFMIGIPLMLLLQIALAVVFVLYGEQIISRLTFLS